ncbi:Protein angel 2 [Geranomyces michiganensis]|nr:Protein angel 2 [Geranomyces michiganensis]
MPRARSAINRPRGTPPTPDTWRHNDHRRHRNSRDDDDDQYYHEHKRRPRSPSPDHQYGSRDRRHGGKRSRNSDECQEYSSRYSRELESEEREGGRESRRIYDDRVRPRCPEYGRDVPRSGREQRRITLEPRYEERTTVSSSAVTHIEKEEVSLTYGGRGNGIVGGISSSSGFGGRDARHRHHVSGAAQQTAMQQKCKSTPSNFVAEPNIDFIPLKREWAEPLPGKDATGNSRHGNGTRFTLFTYNCLAPSLVSQNTQIYRSHMKKHGKKLLDFAARGPNLLADIIAANGDIVCLQEVDECHFASFWEPGLARYGYKGTYLRCTGTKTDGSAILVKTSVMTMVDFQHVQFAPERHNVGVIAMVKINALDRLVCVATTHFLWNPKAGMVKLAQFLILMKRAKEMIEDYEGRTKTDIMLIFAGDFNLVPGSFLHELIVAGEADMAGVEPKFMSGQGMRGGRQGLLPMLKFSSTVRGVPRPAAALAPAMSLDATRIADPAARVALPRTNGARASRSTQQESSEEARAAALPSQDKIIRHPFNFTSAYAPYYDQRTKEPYFSSWHDAAHELVDYILFGRIKPEARERAATRRGGDDGSGSAQNSASPAAAAPVMDLYCVRYLKPPTVHETSKMPNMHAPSDHVYLLAEFDAVLTPQD